MKNVNKCSLILRHGFCLAGKRRFIKSFSPVVLLAGKNDGVEVGVLKFKKSG
jgi:hypothetical protein